MFSFIFVDHFGVPLFSKRLRVANEKLSNYFIFFSILQCCLETDQKRVASITSCPFCELIGCLSVTFGGAPGSNVDDSLDGAYI